MSNKHMSKSNARSNSDLNSNKNSKTKSNSKISLLIYIFIPLIVIAAGLYFLNKGVTSPESDNNSSEEEIYDNPIPTDYPPVLEFQKINPDVVGVLKIPNTVIDYPVIGAKTQEDIDFYLDHNYKKEETKEGSIFADILHTNDLTAKNIMIHGHNMTRLKKENMFSQLLKFADLDFYKGTPTFSFNGQTWKIFAVNKIDTQKDRGKLFDYLVRYFDNDTEFLDYVQEVITRSLIKTSVPINEKDRIMLLSTCSYERENFRTVIFARQIRKGESESVDVSSAEKNPNPLMPDALYSDASSKPQLLDFKTALENGSANWYDGKLKY